MFAASHTKNTEGNALDYILNIFAPVSVPLYTDTFEHMLWLMIEYTISYIRKAVEHRKLLTLGTLLMAVHESLNLDDWHQTNYLC